MIGKMDFLLLIFTLISVVVCGADHQSAAPLPLEERNNSHVETDLMQEIKKTMHQALKDQLATVTFSSLQPSTAKLICLGLQIYWVSLQEEARRQNQSTVIKDEFLNSFDYIKEKFFCNMDEVSKHGEAYKCLEQKTHGYYGYEMESNNVTLLAIFDSEYNVKTHTIEADCLVVDQKMDRLLQQLSECGESARRLAAAVVAIVRFDSTCVRKIVTNLY